LLRFLGAKLAIKMQSVANYTLQFVCIWEDGYPNKNFFEQNIWLVQKKFVPLQPQKARSRHLFFE